MNMEKTQFLSLNRRGREKEVVNLQIVVNEEVLVRCDKVQFLGGYCGQTTQLEGSR